MSDGNSGAGRRLAMVVFGAMQGVSRALRPVLSATGLLSMGRRAFRGRSTFLRDAGGLLLDPPGAPGLARVPFDGVSVTVMPGEAIGRYVTYGAPFEPHEFGLFERILRDGDVVFDVGANYGLYAVVAARRIGRGTLHAFEPNPAIYRLLEQNAPPAAAPGCTVRLHRLAVGDRPGKAELRVSTDSAYSSLVDTGRSATVASVEVEKTSLDAFTRERDIPRVDVLKIDVEGFEPEVIEGAVELLSRPDAPIVLVEIARPNLAPRGLTQRPLVERLVGLGYDVRVAEAALRPALSLDWVDGGVPEENFVAFKPARADRLLPKT